MCAYTAMSSATRHASGNAPSPPSRDTQKSSMRSSAPNLTNSPGAPLESSLCTPPPTSTGAKLLASSMTVAPSSNAGLPRWGQPAHRNASPLPQLPHADFGAACVRSAAASSSSRSPHVQFLQARRWLAASGSHSGLTATFAALSSSSSKSSSSIRAASSAKCPMPAPPPAAADQASSTADSGNAEEGEATGARERSENATPCLYAGLVAATEASAMCGRRSSAMAASASEVSADAGAWEGVDERCGYMPAAAACNCSAVRGCRLTAPTGVRPAYTIARRSDSVVRREETRGARSA
mmetsp:Transcript_30704/g.99298  ORF Transcript_30704/g.99298 Transcript_30704/m.99298 type:complete len:296 (+) Transcript_30704:581-1468(+)